MKDLVEVIAKSLVDHPEEVVVNHRRMPELPRDRAFSRSSIAARTTRAGSGRPMPHAWERCV